MNKTLKGIVIIINLIMLILAVYWYKQKDEIEPIIVGLGQIATLVCVVFERQVSKIITRKIHDKSVVDIDVKAGEHVSTTDVKGSKVTIKTK